jgi:hypothetical protein
MIFMLLFMVPIAALMWLIVVSHSRWPKRIGGAAAAMITAVGAVTARPLLPSDLTEYRIENAREAAALLAASAGSIYLLLWTRMHHGRGRNRTLATIAAVIGLVPVVAALVVALYYQE